MSGRFGFHRQPVTSTAPTQPCCMHSKLFHYNFATVCWNCRRPGHLVKECPFKATTGSSETQKITSASAPRRFKSASARRHDKQRMQEFVIRKQFPYAHLDDTALHHELQTYSYDAQHNINNRECTIATIQSPVLTVNSSSSPHTCESVSTQTLPSSFHMVNADCQTSASITSNLCTQTDVKQFKDLAINVSLPSPNEQCQEDQIASLQSKIEQLESEKLILTYNLEQIAKYVKSVETMDESIRSAFQQLRQRPNQTLHDFAQTVKDLGSSMGISAEGLYIMVCQDLPPVVKSYLHHQQINTVDQLISSSVAQLTQEASQHHTLESLNCHFARPPLTHGKKRKGGRHNNK